MAAKTTSGSAFDCIFRLFVPGFLLESEFILVYVHALTQFRLEWLQCIAKISKFKVPL